MLYLVRFFEMFAVSEEFGPKLVMIIKMLRELGLYLCILAIPLIAHGVADQALLYPRVTSISGETIKNALYYPYFRLYGELFLEQSEGLYIT